MSYIDENNIKWTITDIKTDADGDQICIVESEDGRYDRISALILNIDMFDLDTKNQYLMKNILNRKILKKLIIFLNILKLLSIQMIKNIQKYMNVINLMQ